ncbi:MAG TPA: hypothetical protein VHN20_15800, partial [Beijerinckiaceae bacterium]|nr:hypothetical protein [Beijerinckiaceae bacterium]
MTRHEALPLVFAVLAVSASRPAAAQPLGLNPSAAPSDIGNPSSINPAARASDIRNPGAINPAAAASQIPRTGGPGAPPLAAPPIGRQRVAPLLEPTRRDRAPTTPRQQRRQAAVPTPAEPPEGCRNGRPTIGTWEELKAHLASCWTVPEGTIGSSVTLRFAISAAGELRGAPMTTATHVVPREMSARYKDAATRTLDRCLPVCPGAGFGAVLHENPLYLRLVNDAPFPSRNHGPWMTIFA